MSIENEEVGYATAVMSVPHDLDRRQDFTGNIEYTPEWETKTAISHILDIVLKPISFTRQLEEILDVVVSISWLRAERKGAIFVTNARNELVLVVHHDLAPELLKQCATVPFGHCLCGKAAEQKRILFRDCVDHDHDIRFDTMKPHGHYNIPLLGNRGEVIGVIVLYLQHGHKPHREEKNFTEMLGRIISSMIYNRNLQLRSEINRARLRKAELEMLHKLVAASEFRDNETGEHIKRLSRYSAVIGQKIGLSDKDIELLRLAIPMHDIGKMGISDSILLKNGRLTPEEFSIMQQHTVIGAKILNGSHPLMVASRQIAISHHEKWDGSGYPNGLAGTEIPLFGRICALVDVFDALSTKRPYKEPWPLEEVLAFIKQGSGSHFDPELVDALMDSLPEILEIKALYADTDWDASDIKVLEERPVSRTSVHWNKRFSTGVQEIDEQHQYLLNLIDRIENAVREYNSKEIVDVMLDMKLYAEVHFSEEEELMRKVGYPKLEPHIQRHKQFISKADQFLDELELTPLAVTSEAIRFLRDWLVTHIQTVDADYARFIRKKSLSA